MQDVVSIDLRRYHTELARVDQRRLQTDASIAPEDTVSAACTRLNDEDSPLLTAVRILQSGRPLTNAECLELGRAVADVVECTREGLRDQHLDTGWFIAEGD